MAASLCAHGSVRYAAWLGGKQSGKTGCEPAAQRGGGGRGSTGRPVDFGSDAARFFFSFFVPLPALFALQPSSHQTSLLNQSPPPPSPNTPSHKDRRLNRDGSPSLSPHTSLPPPSPPTSLPPPPRPTWPLSPSGCRNYPPRFMFLPLLAFHALPDLCFPGPGQVGKHCVASLTFQHSRCHSL